VIALDLKATALHRRHEGVTISAMADDVDEVLIALDLSDVVLAGHSMGGMVCLRLAGTTRSWWGRVSARSP